MISLALHPHPLILLIVIGLCAWGIYGIVQWHDKKWHAKTFEKEIRQQKRRKQKNKLKKTGRL